MNNLPKILCYVDSFSILKRSVAITGWAFCSGTVISEMILSFPSGRVYLLGVPNLISPDVAAVHGSEAGRCRFDVQVIIDPDEDILNAELIIRASNGVSRLEKCHYSKEKEVGILDSYVLNAPNNQNVLDIFKGEWSSILPNEFALVTHPGSAPLFEDVRISWAEEVFGNFTNWKILELGPLEAGHSYMLQNRGAGQIISIEANTRAFLKCLCIKEILKLDKVEFKLGDFMPFLRTDNTKYDMVLASGVLYHQEEPIELLKMISKVSDKTLIWTQYYDENIISGRSDFANRFSPPQLFEYDGVSYEFSIQAYQDALNWSGFCGGPKTVSKWLTKDSIIKALKHYGYVDIQINFDAPGSLNGPALAICAKK